MHIQWFPGHMTKALRMMRENAKLVDCFLYVLDARAVYSCINPSFDELLGNKPVLYIVNKADLVEAKYLEAIKTEFDRRGWRYVFCNSKQGASAKIIVNEIRKMNSAKLEKYKAKGVNITVRAMVIGIPNTGKSTVVNSLCGNKRAMTGNRPGVTRGKQWVVLEQGIELLDTPGTLCPAFDNQTTAAHLAYLGSINDVIIDTEELSLSLTEWLMNNFPDQLRARYNIEELESKPVDVIKQIARVRGFILKGNEIDYDRAYVSVIDDFRKSRFGLLALE